MKLRSVPLSLFFCCSVSTAQVVKDIYDTLIKNSGSKECIRMGNYDNIFVGTCIGGKAQWDVKLFEPGVPNFTINLSGTGKCLDGSGRRPKRPVEASKCDYNFPRSKSQTWTVISAGNRIQNRVTKECMEMDRSSGALFLTGCKEIPDQNFKIKSKPSRIVGERIVSFSTYQCMKVDSNGEDVKAGSCIKGDVNWSYKKSTKQFQYVDKPSTGMCLDAADGNDGIATVSTCNVGTQSQKWIYVSNTIRSIKKGNRNKCLRLNLSTSQINLRECGDGAQFQFEFRGPTTASVTKSVE